MSDKPMQSNSSIVPSKKLARYSRPRMGYSVEEWRELYDKSFWEVNFGTINALMRYTRKNNAIIFVGNSIPGNGHFAKFMDWAEQEAFTDGKPLIVEMLWNKQLFAHLIEKRGYKVHPKMGDSVIKRRKTIP